MVFHQYINKKRLFNISNITTRGTKYKLIFCSSQFSVSDLFYGFYVMKHKDMHPNYYLV